MFLRFIQTHKLSSCTCCRLQMWLQRPAAWATAGVTVQPGCSFRMDEHYSVDAQRAQSEEGPQRVCCGAQGEGSVRGKLWWMGRGAGLGVKGTGVTYVLHSPLQNGVYLCIQGLDSLLAWRIWKQQFTAQLSYSAEESSYSSEATHPSTHTSTCPSVHPPIYPSIIHTLHRQKPANLLLFLVTNICVRCDPDSLRTAQLKVANPPSGSWLLEV